MSLPEDLSIELKLSRKKLKCNLGDAVKLIHDPKERLYVVAGLLPDGSYEKHNDDYILKRISNQGKSIHITTTQKEIIKIP